MNLWRLLIVAMALLLGAALEIAWQAGPAPAAEDVPSMANQSAFSSRSPSTSPAGSDSRWSRCPCNGAVQEHR
jgi:hypothetical protein